MRSKKTQMKLSCAETGKSEAIISLEENKTLTFAIKDGEGGKTKSVTLFNEDVERLRQFITIIRRYTKSRSTELKNDKKEKQ